ncbi:MAG: Uncharacterized protein G01um101429_759 [Parcubacteria group bacterium Gr01-1014_29]|nr:MAG: Uncharacterized protein G01um101429_759 [Parcubacteria group bacterium Gr01-1014_29]
MIFSRKKIIICNAKNSRGFGIVEIIVALSVMVLALSGVVTAVGLSLRAVKETTRKTQAAYLLEETLEAVKHLRDQSWNTHITSLTINTEYYLDFTGGHWEVITASVPVSGIFTRSFRLENVLRDSNDDIASTGTLDPDTKKLIATVTWTTPTVTASESASTYITNLFGD